ncbi:MAG: alpha/beta fold hydrolase [Candidatus Eisenbacteria bacterium]|uniref:Alpha/beta fold hydrolase n=1 Tax=Eiseniibacteriota bacterium TaxID=2212470 RepID=A0A538TZD8_UNCEI|nr:MAG: alpha/beta fold hydrolase [Candidatus Eisenbacteria bacterium]
MPTRLQQVTLLGPAGALEGALHAHESRAPELTAVVCHPHPSYGGTLHNKVVHRVASTLHDLGADVLRFNFRGVGRSEGRYDEGRGELEDARAAVRWMHDRTPGARLWLAGFSFGAWVAARLSASEPIVERLILVAPPVTRSGFDVLRHFPVPKLVIQGLDDTTCPPADLEREFALWSEPKTLVRVPGAAHFFDRQLGALGAAIRETWGDAARGALR